MKKTCSLMSTDQCKWPEYCKTDCQCGDVGCHGENGGPPAPPDDKKSCASGSEYKDEEGVIWIHWACIPPASSRFPQTYSSPYNPNTPMPADTICFTTQK